MRQLTSPTLTFDRDGMRLIVIEADHVAVMDSTGTVRIAQPHARAAIGFADQIWIASEDETLHRYTPSGQPIGTPMLLPYADHPQFVAAPCGPPTAVWGDAAWHTDPHSQLVRTPLPPVELALPVTYRQFVISAWRRLMLPSGKATPFQAEITGGAVLADGAEVAIALDDELVLVALATGKVLSRMPVPSGPLRIATQRAIAIVLTSPTTLAAVDLRSGRSLGTIALPHATSDIAISPDGKHVALRGEHVTRINFDRASSPARPSPARIVCAAPQLSA